MKKKRFWLIVLSINLTLSTLMACTTPAPALSKDDQAAIYATVVRQLYTVDHTFGDEPPNFPKVYLLRTTYELDRPDAPQIESGSIPKSTQAAIVAALDDLPAEFVWVDHFDEVPLSHGDVEGRGAVITLSNLQLKEEGSVLVMADLFFASAGGAGMTYIIEQVDGVWQVVVTMNRWMS